MRLQLVIVPFLIMYFTFYTKIHVNLFFLPAAALLSIQNMPIAEKVYMDIYIYIYISIDLIT